MSEETATLFGDPVSGLTGCSSEGDVVPARGRARFSGALLRQRRLRAGLTLEDLAVLVGVTQSAVGAWEHGQASPRADHLAALAAALDVASIDLYGAGLHDLVALRKLAGLSRETAAAAAQVSLSSLARYERGTAAVPAEIRERLAVSYELDEATIDAACVATVQQRLDLATARRARRY